MILTGLQRRQLLKAAVALPLILLRQFPLPQLWAAPEHDVSGSRRKQERLLVLVELQGGNDGLNTLVPFEERGYYEARTQLAIPRNQVRQLTRKRGVHLALTPLMSLW